MPRWVLLRHNFPDRSWHYDWMLDPGPRTDPAAKLITFRLTSRPDDPQVESFTAERIPDHRRDYLTYEGSLSNNRGQVHRIAEGECRIASINPLFLLDLHTTNPATTRHLRGTPIKDRPGWYDFRVSA